MVCNIGTQMHWVDDLKNILFMSRKYKRGDVWTCDCQFCCGEWYFLVLDYNHYVWLGHEGSTGVIIGTMKRIYKISESESFHDYSFRLLYRSN